ncbi:general substrate transporter [Pseudovirgaria hyperparasitica]|uniref:General substrate transporter n=1 Tax=Pseudovirgaria hyperparasitica TaxID=470096 RepID=A0A6A6WIT0_9PEZI|nr:general substrate transporter [Pseudovirgaria hyperparasitica]KAF2762229.1 general substrate transporter [Pseudovirgaria hyperparasitica]
MTILIGRPLTRAITATAAAGFLLFGYDQGVLSGLLTGDAFTRTFPEIDTRAGAGGSATLQGTVVAVYNIGCFVGALVCMVVGERLGRRKCIMMGCVIMTAGAVVEVTSRKLAQLMTGLVVAGFGNGFNTSTIPVWLSELANFNKRGQGIAVTSVINIFGVMVAYWVDYGMSFVPSDAQFRFPLSLQILFALITLAGISVLPESPRWLIAHGRSAEARHILWAVEKNARSMTEQDESITAKVEEIHLTVEEERKASKSGSYISMLHNGPQRFLYRTMLGVGGHFIQQFAGINLISWYIPVIFQQSVGLSRNTSLLLSGFNGLAYCLCAIIPIPIIDRVGRRKLMLFALVGQGACMAVLSGTVADGGKAAGIVSIVMLFLFNFFFAIGCSSIPWLWPAEYSPLAIRTRVASLCTAASWLFTFLIVEVMPISIKNIGWRTYLYFCIFNFISIPFVYFFYPETQNLSLEQIDRLFTGDKIAMRWTPEMDVDGLGSSDDNPDRLNVGSMLDKACAP